ncbi:MAG: hypothetical protein GOU99_02685 [Candidatus Altiarchaeota archaeon]|nr:hypothetical protein [Candidatus Altiarchaeota archaeon]
MENKNGVWPTSDNDCGGVQWYLNPDKDVPSVRIATLFGEQTSSKEVGEFLENVHEITGEKISYAIFPVGTASRDRIATELKLKFAGFEGVNEPYDTTHDKKPIFCRVYNDVLMGSKIEVPKGNYEVAQAIVDGLGIDRKIVETEQEGTVLRILPDNSVCYTQHPVVVTSDIGEGSDTTDLIRGKQKNLNLVAYSDVSKQYADMMKTS